MRLRNSGSRAMSGTSRLSPVCTTRPVMPSPIAYCPRAISSAVSPSAAANLSLPTPLSISTSVPRSILSLSASSRMTWSKTSLSTSVLPTMRLTSDRTTISNSARFISSLCAEGGPRVGAHRSCGCRIIGDGCKGDTGNGVVCTLKWRCRGRGATAMAAGFTKYDFIRVFGFPARNFGAGGCGTRGGDNGADLGGCCDAAIATAADMRIKLQDAEKSRARP